jgi:hypothetical protein
MDLKQFFRKLRQIEADILAPFVVVVSKETPDGGKAGVLTEVSRATAAQLIAGGKAEIAVDEAVKVFREKAAEVKRLADQAVAASRIQVTVLTESDVKALKGGRPAKGS